MRTILGRARRFARARSSVHNEGRAVGDAAPSSPPTHLPPQTSARSTSAPRVPHERRRTQPRASEFEPQRTRRIRRRFKDLKTRENIVVVVVQRGRVDKPGMSLKLAGKSCVLLSKTAPPESGSADIRDPPRSSASLFPRSPQPRTSPREKPWPQCAERAAIQRSRGPNCCRDLNNCTMDEQENASPPAPTAQTPPFNSPSTPAEPCCTHGFAHRAWRGTARCPRPAAGSPACACFRRTGPEPLRSRCSP